jgi:hypothetical protein
VVVIISLLTGGLGVVISDAATGGAGSLWQRVLSAAGASGESYLPSGFYSSPTVMSETGAFAANSLLMCAAVCLVLALLLWLRHSSPKLTYIIAGLAILEIFTFGRASITTFDLAAIRQPEAEQLLATHPGDYRILQLSRPNNAMYTGAQDIWGYDPFVMGRYGQFMAFSQGGDPDEVTVNVSFKRPQPLYDMLRCRYVLISKQGSVQIGEIGNPMPRLQLIQDYAVLTGRDDIFAALTAPAFDPRHEVILETAPHPQPVKSVQQGTVKLVDSSTDQLTIQANLPQPAILLITDAYSENWKAVPLADSAQQQYQVLPANYVLRAIPLAAGKHHLRLEYSPPAIRIGKWISVAAVIIYLICLTWYLLLIYRRPGPIPTPL